MIISFTGVAHFQKLVREQVDILISTKISKNAVFSFYAWYYIILEIEYTYLGK